MPTPTVRTDITYKPLGFGQGQQGSGVLGPSPVVSGPVDAQGRIGQTLPNILPGLIGGTQAFQQQAQQAAGQFNTNFGQFTPQLQSGFSPIQLQTQFGAPQFSQGLDPISQQLLSQAQQTQRLQMGAQQQQLGQQFRRQPGLLSILANQAQQRAALSQNALPFEALVQQRGRELQDYQAQQQAQGLTNQALLQQGGFNMAGQQAQNQALLSQQGAQNLGQSLGNQALAQQLGVSGAGMDAQQSLAAVLGSLYQLFNPNLQG